MIPLIAKWNYHAHVLVSRCSDITIQCIWSFFLLIKALFATETWLSSVVKDLGWEMGGPRFKTGLRLLFFIFKMALFKPSHMLILFQVESKFCGAHSNTLWSKGPKLLLENLELVHTWVSVAKVLSKMNVSTEISFNYWERTCLLASFPPFSFTLLLIFRKHWEH